jgi:hypothetical protein
MASGQPESANERAERAIVANSLAAAQEEALAEAGNPTAKRVARKRAEEASAELQQALDAVHAERQRRGERP